MTKEEEMALLKVIELEEKLEKEKIKLDMALRVVGELLVELKLNNGESE